MKSKHRKGIIIVYKFDGNDPQKGIKGSEFTVYSHNGKKKGIISTDKSGYGHSKELNLGKYLMVESKSPKKYKTDKRPIYITLLGCAEDGVVIKKIYSYSKKLKKLNIKALLQKIPTL